jgi:cell division protein FtsW (lipid II flippase)
MSLEEKRAWIFLIVTLCAYTAYVVIILGRAGEAPLAEVAYAATLLWSIVWAIAASIVLHIAASIASPRDAGKKDQRDREIHRFGEYIGQSFVILGSTAALGMAMFELPYFWIANTIYLAFVLSAILGSTAKLVAYRRGFQPW